MSSHQNRSENYENQDHSLESADSMDEDTAAKENLDSTEATNHQDEEDAFLVVGIGASAGGLEAFQAFLRNMPADSGIAFVLISHLAPDHNSLLSELLAKETEMRVVQAENETPVQPNHVYVIPPNTTLVLRQRTIYLYTPEKARGHRTPIDIFFTSLAEDQKENAACIILSGTGSDGTIGLKAIKENGGLTIAQDSKSAKYDGMPRNAILTGLVDYVLAVEEIPAKLLEDVRHRQDLRENLGVEGIFNETAENLNKICSILRRNLGHDFSGYKQNTLIRRIQRRIRITQSASVSEYVEILRNDEAEIKALFQDLLIGVTQFFRDPEAFASLKENVLVPLVDRCTPEKPIRIWVAGCSSGEEAYSIAISLCEVIGFRDLRSCVQIFATDIDGHSLEIARQGRYPEGIAEQVTPERLELYFTQEDNSYRINKAIRETCIFSQHSVISDPPFSRLDLITCRNVLIYFDTELKDKLLPLFHYALNEGGYLFLGPSENINDQNKLFYVADKQYRIFQRKEVMISPQVEFPLSDRSPRSVAQLQRYQPPERQHRQRVQEAIEQVLLQEYSPPCVIINEQYEVVYFFGRTGKYLEPSQGLPSNNIIDLARRGLRLQLRTAIQEAFSDRKIVTKKQVTIENEDRMQLITLIARPLKDGDRDSNLLMVIFKDTVMNPQTREAGGTESTEDRDRESPLVRELEVELQKTREHLRTTIEELETSNEELKSANEELLSMNEELQSSNEELQTSKEEMQSINEELETVNAELRSKVEELDEVNSDVQNFLESTNIATIFLDLQLRIKQFTPAATNLFNFIQTDIGRPLTDIALSLDNVNLAADLRQVVRTLIPLEKEVTISQENRHYKMRIMPYRTVENAIDGAVITFVDITDLRHARNQAEYWANQQSAIAELGLYGIQNNDFAAICDRAVDIVCTTLTSDFCSLFRCISNASDYCYQLLLSNGNNWPEDMVGNAVIDISNSQVGYALNQPSPVVVEDADTENRFDLLPILCDRGIEVKSGLSVTIYGVDRPYGVLAIHSLEAHQYTAEDTSFLQAIANTISAAYQRHQRTEALIQSSERLDLAITAGQMGIWEYDVATGLSNWNDIEYELFGLNPAEAEQPSADLFFQYVHPDDVERVREDFEAKIATQEEFINEFRVDLPNQELRWLAARGRAIADEQGNTVKVIGVNYDVSERKLTEEALKEADRRKDQFLAALGHELRNPLNALYHSLALLKDAQDRNREGQIQKIMERQVKLLTRLIDDLLDASRLAYGKIQVNREPLDLIQLLRHILADHQAYFEENNLECNAELPEQPIWVNGDRTRLTQAFANILHNASKFSHEGDQVDIRVEYEENRVTIVVTDTGIGMDKTALDRIFTAFSQEEHSLQRSGGLGLGLPVTKGIIELHEGRIWASSDGLEQGSQFHVELPRINDEIEDPEPVADTSSDSAAGTNSGRVLVIEDNFDSALLIQLLLEGLGYEVELAHNGEEGLNKAQTFQPKFIISDIGLPGGLNGYDVARAIRDNPDFQATYMIAMSGYGQQEDKDQAKAAGFDHHITKPINIEEIQQLIQSQSRSS